MQKKEVRKSLTRQAYEEIKWRIIADELQVGTLLTKNDLCELTGFGKAPIQAALIELQHYRLIEVVPRKGFFIRPWNREEARELIMMRRLIEPILVGESAKKATKEDLEELQRIVAEAKNHVRSANRRLLIESDNEFHVGISRASGSAVGTEVVEMLKLRSHLLWHVTISNQRQLEVVQFQHEKILTRILDRDSEGAACAMLEHLSSLETE
ncbi:MAG: GntR family transcriptional regulator [Aestuariivita sp.]|nr:GntR family transcriptional regulator [Aestuariivita sp.]